MTHGSTSTGSYLLTEDIGQKFEAFRHTGLKTPDPHSQFFDDAQTEIAAALSEALGENHPVIRTKMYQLADEVIEMIDRLWPSAYVVSTCPEIAHPSKGSAYEINRIVDMNGVTIGMGARPGAETLEVQASKIAARLNNRRQPVVLAEDGIFSGGTITQIVDLLREKGVNIVGVVAGFSFNHAGSDIRDSSVRVEVVHDYGALYDWVPDHDFVPFAPGCGKVLGVKVGGKCYPFYDHNHATFSIPYLKPFGPISDWASIPPDKASKFSGRCLMLALSLFDELERINGKEILISDIVHSRQRVSIPVTVDADVADRVHQFPSVSTGVRSFLAECL